MFDWCNKLRRLGRALWKDDGGASAMEFALVLPVLALVLSGFVEVGRSFEQAAAVEKGLRAAALYVARADTPFTAADQQTATNLARTGTVDGSAPLLAPGWAKLGATVEITTTTYTVDDHNIPVIKVSAQVPFEPLMPGLASLFGLADHILEMSTEQAYVGD